MKNSRLLSEGGRAVGAEDLALRLRDQRHTTDVRELQVLRQHLLHVSAADLVLLDDGSLQDLDAGRLSTVAAGHLADHLTNSTVDRDIPVLLVHVVGVGTGLVSEPDAVVGDDGRRLVQQLSLTQDLTSGSLSLVNLLHEVPELGAGEDLVLGEELHLVDLRDRVLLGRGSTSDDLELLHLRAQGVLLDLSESFLHHFCEVWRF